MLPTSMEARVYNPASQNKEFLSLVTKNSSPLLLGWGSEEV